MKYIGKREVPCAAAHIYKRCKRYAPVFIFITSSTIK